MEKEKHEKYIAYVGTYTHGVSEGIHIYDMDVDNGKMKEQKVVKIKNPSYLTKSRDGKFLYSIADEGVEAFRILPDGDLEAMNTASIEGMRGCYISTDRENHYLFTGGYHDGKVSVVKILEDGSLDKLTDGVFHRGMGSVAERNFRPHVNCVTLTPDEKYLCAVDLGLDHVKIYYFDHNIGKIKLVDIVRCELESAPRQIVFSADGKYAYLICELKNYINVYSYKSNEKGPKFELLQQVSTLAEDFEGINAASAMEISLDGNHLICSNAGDNSIGLYKIDKNSGLLEQIFVLPISGEYPKDIAFFPDGKHVMSLNHESNSITIFKVDYEEGLLVMDGKPLRIDTPNCIVISKINV